MKCAEQVRNVYVQVQMWKAIYRYIISTNAALVPLFGIPSLPLYLDVMYVSSKGAGEVFIWTTDRSGVSKGRDEGGNFKEGNANSRRHISCHSPEKHILCFLKGNLTMVFIA